jgi:Fe-S cluster assembly protein SufD
MNTRLPTEMRDAYAAGFAHALAHSAGLPSWLTGARKSAFDAFVEQGWPTTKQEDWRFTDVTPIMRLGLLPPPTAQPQFREDDFDAKLLNLGSGLGHRLVFVDGQYQAGLSTWQALPRDLLVAPMSSIVAGVAGDAKPLHDLLGRQLGSQNAFVALSTAFMTDGALVHIPAGLSVELPIYLIFLSANQGAASFPRTVVLAGENSQATVVEVHIGAADRTTLSNAVTEIVLAPHARLAHHSIQKMSPTGFHVGHIAVTQQADSAFSGHSLFLDGRIVRNDVCALLSGERCACNLDGLYLAGGSSHIDNHTTIDHRMPKSTSRESYRGVVDGRSRAVFNGRIVVRPGAQQTDARQTSRNLILTDGAVVHTKPHLEIFANDVKCAHGATIGRLDEESLFYLRSRGIGVREANQILIGAFMREGLERVAFSPLREELEKVLVSRIDDMTNATNATMTGVST